MKSPTLYDGERLTLDDSVALTAESLRTYGTRYRRWALAWSGGKDSTALVTLVVYLIATGQVPRPDSLHVLYADTRMELLPLAIAAQQMMGRLREYPGVYAQRVLPLLDERFFVYMLGRGVPPPNNRTLRWCTDAIKLRPMQRALAKLAGNSAEKMLMLIGVRTGESAARDQRIAIACSRDGAECGQGWFQRDLPDALADKLCPILHWRVCHVWDWLQFLAPEPEYGSWPTRLLADAYGGDEAQEINARTGCVGCPLAERDTALEAVVRQSAWSYLAPLLELRPIYRGLRLAQNRLRQPPGERRKDGTLTSSQNRMGPLTMPSRLEALDRILDVQRRVNVAADIDCRPHIDLLDAEETARIRELIAANTWPQKWTGDEPTGDELYEDQYQDGSRQLLLPILGQEGGAS